MILNALTNALKFTLERFSVQILQFTIIWADADG